MEPKAPNEPAIDEQGVPIAEGRGKADFGGASREPHGTGESRRIFPGPGALSPRSTLAPLASFRGEGPGERGFRLATMHEES